MSITIAGLGRKIEGAKDLRSVVRTMKAVSASNLGQYEDSVRGLGEYYHSIELGLGVCLRNKTLEKTYQETNPTSGTFLVLVFGSDQGMVGQFNTSLGEFTQTTLADLGITSQVWTLGERMYEQLVGTNLSLAGNFKVPTSIKAIGSLVGEILLLREKQFDHNRIEGLYLIYNRPKTQEIYEPIAQRLLPLDHHWFQNLRDLPWPSTIHSEVVGNDTQTLSALIDEYLFISLFRACAESLASENASRLAAMERADQNIDDLLKDLNRTFHRLRKEGIDAELFDVIAGFDLLQSS